MQLRAAAVSWRASCNWLPSFMFVQIASTAESSSLRAVLVIRSPQIDSTPPPAVITAWVMFELLDFSVPACVPQKPGVRQIVSPQPAGDGFAGTEWHWPVAALQTSVVQMSASWEQEVGAPDAHVPVPGLHDSTVQRLSSWVQVSLGPDSHPPVAALHDSKVQRSPSCVHVLTGPDAHCPF